MPKRKYRSIAKEARDYTAKNLRGDKDPDEDDAVLSRTKRGDVSNYKRVLWSLDKA